jgi:hypothetical protein
MNAIFRHSLLIEIKRTVEIIYFINIEKVAEIIIIVGIIIIVVVIMIRIVDTSDVIR